MNRGMGENAVLGRTFNKQRALVSETIQTILLREPSSFKIKAHNNYETVAGTNVLIPRQFSLMLERFLILYPIPPFGLFHLLQFCVFS